MRKLLCIFGLLFCHTAGFAEGYVRFANLGGGVNAPVLNYLDAVFGPGPEWTVQLLLKERDDLVPLLPQSTFRGWSATDQLLSTRYWVTTTNEVPGILPGQTATFVVRAWKTSFGSYEAALPSGFVGESAPVTITVGEALNPAPLTGFEGFWAGPFPKKASSLAITSFHPPVFSVETSGVPVHNIETSSDLRNWSPYLSISSRLETVRVRDLSGTADAQPSAFFRVRLAAALPPSLPNWQSRGISSYRFKFERICFCRPFSLSGTVLVRGGKITLVSDARGDGMPIANPDLSQFKTINDLFALVEDASSGADLLSVSYDPYYYFPRVIDIDYIANAADDEITYYISEFERLP